MLPALLPSPSPVHTVGAEGVVLVEGDIVVQRQRLSGRVNHGIGENNALLIRPPTVVEGGGGKCKGV